ncbi:hypothetical protein, partial [Limnospira sp. PMC 1223.20]|uniref:hypothetical protein n=1 Tax=Limnospira sp. PMC 1223.20 TaxID=2981021 RepID=UPI0028E0B34C
VFKDKQLAIDINHVAIQIADRLKSPIHKWKTIYVLNTFLYHWKKPLREDIHSFERIIKGCQESGDMLYAGFSSAMDTYKKLNVGYALSLLINDLDYYMNFLKANEDDYTIDFIQSTNISARILGDENFPRKKSISNEDFDEDEFENLVLAKKNYSAVACLHIDRLKVCYYLEEFD